MLSCKKIPAGYHNAFQLLVSDRFKLKHRVVDCVIHRSRLLGLAILKMPYMNQSAFIGQMKKLYSIWSTPNVEICIDNIDNCSKVYLLNFG